MLLGLFEKILSISLIGGYMICVVFLVRLLLRKCERKFSYFLWLVVFLNLCLPISINAPFSLIPQKVVSVAEEVSGGEVPSVKGNVTGGEETIVLNPAEIQGADKVTAQHAEELYIEYLKALGMNSEDYPIHIEGEGEIVQGTRPTKEATSSTASTTNKQEALVVQGDEEDEVSGTQADAHIVLSKASLTDILSVVWIIGMMIIGVISCIQMLRLNKRVKSALQITGQQEEILCVEGIESPFLWGIWRPTIYLPTNIDASEKEYIVAHESYHKKRGDHIVKLLVFAVVAVHWFNPLVWAAYVFFIRDMEISCDEAVLSHAEKNINKQYANSLLKYAAKQNGFVLSPLTFGEPSLKSRIRNVLQFKKRGVAVTVIAVCVVALTACGLVLRTESVETMGPDKEQEEQQSGEKPQDGEPSGGDVQPGETQKGGGGSQTTATEEKVPEYTEWEVGVAKQFQVMLGVEDENFVETVLQGRDVGQEYILHDDAGEHYYSYHANLDTTEENGFRCEIKWMKLADSVVLQEWHISLQKELEGLTKHASLGGVFYVEEQNRVFIPIFSMQGPDIEVEGMADTWVLTFPIDNPDNNQLYSYDGAEGAWFGETLRLGDWLYLHGGATDIPYEIDFETMKGRPCKEELAVAEDAAADYIAEYKAQTGMELHIYWFQAVAGYEDIILFAGQIAEAMDFPTVATVYLAMQDGEVLKTRIVEAEEGEINYGFITENNEAEQLNEEEIKWFNVNFFNQSYLNTKATRQEKIRNQFLTCEYSSPEEINLTDVFYNGIGEELTDEDWQCLSGEARWIRPLHTTDMEVLSEEEHAQVAALAQELDVIKVSEESMRSILLQYTGQVNRSIWGGVGMDSAYFNKKDGVFYWIHSDTNMMCVYVEKGYRNPDGSVTLVYRTTDTPYVESAEDNSAQTLIFDEGATPEWLSDEQYIAILKPNGEEYQFCLNVSIENLKKISNTGDKEILGTIIYADAETIVIDEKQWITWQDEEWKDEYDAPNGYMVLDVSNELLECPISEDCTIAALDEQTSSVLEEFSFADKYEEVLGRANNLFHIQIKDGKVVFLWEQYEP